MPDTLEQLLRDITTTTWHFCREGHNAPATGQPLSTKAVQAQVTQIKRLLVIKYPIQIENLTELINARPRTLLVICYKSGSKTMVRYYRRGRGHSTTATWTRHDRTLRQPK